MATPKDQILWIKARETAEL